MVVFLRSSSSSTIQAWAASRVYFPRQALLCSSAPRLSTARPLVVSSPVRQSPQHNINNRSGSRVLPPLEGPGPWNNPSSPRLAMSIHRALSLAEQVVGLGWHRRHKNTNTALGPYVPGYGWTRTRSSSMQWSVSRKSSRTSTLLRCSIKNILWLITFLLIDDMILVRTFVLNYFKYFVSFHRYSLVFFMFPFWCIFIDTKVAHN